MHKIPALMGRMMQIFKREEVEVTVVDDQGEEVTVFRPSNEFVEFQGIE